MCIMCVYIYIYIHVYIYIYIYIYKMGDQKVSVHLKITNNKEVQETF